MGDGAGDQLLHRGGQGAEGQTVHGGDRGECDITCRVNGQDYHGELLPFLGVWEVWKSLTLGFPLGQGH